MKLPLPTDILIQTAGAFLVGGSVRDLICGRRPMDYDITVTHDPEGYAQQVAAKLNSRVVTIGKPGFPLYRVVKTPLMVDVTPIKGDHIESDLADRDFTINALACELTSAEVIDTTGGLADIDQKVVRMVSDQALPSDPVRMLRAYRMAAQLDFAIEPATRRAISAHADAIKTCAGERVWAELFLILAQSDSFTLLQQMARDQLLLAILPELAPLQGCRQNKPHHLDVFDHTFLAFQSLEALLARADELLSGAALPFTRTLSPQRKALLKLALLLHDIGKPGTRTTDSSGKIHFYGHAAASLELCETICQRLRMSKRQTEWVKRLIANHSRPHDLYRLQEKNALTQKAIGRFLRQCGDITPYLILHAIADNYGKDLSDPRRIEAQLQFFNKLLDAFFDSAEIREAGPLVGGADLMATFNLKPSPLLGTLLEGIEETRLAGTISSRQEALGWAEDYLKRNGVLSE